MPGNSEYPVVLTAHPLQRIGACALPALIKVCAHPERLTTPEFEAARDEMTKHLTATAAVDSAADNGGFWLAASYALWPNSKINPTSRAKQPIELRRALIRKWREVPPSDEWPNVPCAYCDRPACGWFGKVDIPLGASVEHRNTTAPGHQGTPLCYPCLVCLWAFPYGATLSGGRAATVHSWADDFLLHTTQAAVSKTRQAATTSRTVTKPTPHARELTVLGHLRSFSRRIDADVELIVLSNANKEQFLRNETMSRPTAEWLRNSLRKADRRAGYRTLTISLATKDIDGEANLARLAFQEPHQVLHRVVSRLVDEATEVLHIPATKTAALRPLIYSYCTEVLDMDEKDVARLTALAQRLATMLGRDDEPRPVMEFFRANRSGGELNRWFRRKSIDWLRFEKRDISDSALLPVDDYRLLFDNDRAWSHRQLLIFAVIEALARNGWRIAGSDDDIDDITAAADAASNNINEEGDE